VHMLPQVARKGATLRVLTCAVPQHTDNRGGQKNLLLYILFAGRYKLFSHTLETEHNSCATQYGRYTMIISGTTRGKTKKACTA
jgi:hypothetical protein